MKKTREERNGKLLTDIRDIDMTVVPINRRIVVRKCVNDHIRGEDGDVVIYKPDEVYEECGTVEIMEVASDCRIFKQEDVGGFINIPDYLDGLDVLDEEKELWFVDERIIDDAIEAGVIFTED